MTPEALRRRMAHGNVYGPEKVDAALANYFRVGNLTALRELALLWVADRVDEGLARYRAEHGIDQPWPARERVVVALTGGTEGRDADPARRAHRRADGRAGAARRARRPQRRADRRRTRRPRPSARARREPRRHLPHRRGGRTSPRRCSTSPVGSTPRQLVIGVSRRQAGWSGCSGRASVTRSSGIRGHRRPHRHARAGRTRRPGHVGPESLSQRRVVIGWGMATAGPLLLAGAALRWRCPGLPVAEHGSAALPHADRQRRARRRALAGSGRRGRVEPRPQLGLHPALRHTHDRRGRERAGAGHLRGGRRRGGERRGPRGPAHQAGIPGPERGVDAVDLGGQRPDRRGGRWRRCSTGSERPSP